MLLTLNDVQYNIPEKWNQVSIENYQKFMLNHDDKQDDYTKTLNIISSFTGVPFKELEQCKKSDIDKIDKVLSKLLDDKIKEELNLIITIDDIEYGFHPNLKDLTFGEFVDLDNYLLKPIENLHLILAVLYRRIKSRNNKKYKIENYDSTECVKNAKIFKEKLSVSTAQSASSFFLLIGKQYKRICKHLWRRKRTRKA